MSKLIEALNANIHLSPDEIVAKISDPLAQWQPMTEFVTPENYDSMSDRDVAMYSVAGGSGQIHTGFYCVVRAHMTGGRYSYRTDNSEHATTQNMSDYEPASAAGCGGWWVIGWEYRDTPPPTTPAPPSHDRYEPEYYDDDDEDFD